MRVLVTGGAGLHRLAPLRLPPRARLRGGLHGQPAHRLGRQYRPHPRRAIPVRQARRDQLHRRRRARSTTCCTSRARPRPSTTLELPIPTLKVGALGTHKALGLAKARGAKFLLASTSEVYGDPLVHPQHEEYWGNVNPVGPRGVYDEAKRFAEAMTMAYHRVPRARHAHRAHLQHLRPAHAAHRRPRDPHVHPPGARAASPSPSTATAARRARSPTSPISSTGSGS